MTISRKKAKECGTLAKAIIKTIEDHPLDTEPYGDLLYCLREWSPDGRASDEAHVRNRRMQKMIQKVMPLATPKQAGELYEHYKHSLCWEATVDFDSFLKYVELEAPPEKQFYKPRRCYLKPIVDAYQEVLDGKLHLLTISLPKRAGKALTLDTPIITPYGYERMGDVQIGDEVIGADGKPAKVTAVFPQGKVPVYRVTFSDGASVRTCGEHLWKVRYHDINKGRGVDPYSERVMTTSEMLSEGVKQGKSNKHNVFSIPYCQPVEFMERDLPLDPYLLGVLLGDGAFTQTTISVTTPDEEIVEDIRRRLPDGDKLDSDGRQRYRYFITPKTRKTDKRGHMLKCDTVERLEALGLIGKRSYEKYIPLMYLYASVEQRIELLRGLLDTDGYSESKFIEYSTTSPELRDGVILLVKSLGGKATYSSRMGRYKDKAGEYHETRENYRVHIFFPSDIQPFKLSRKAEGYQPKRDTLYHYIESIEPCGEDYAQCITVDNTEHMYLCGEFIPTHNSQLGINFTAMLSGREPDRSTLMEGTGESLINSFYSGLLEYLQQPTEYLYYDVFPDAKLVATGADDHVINLKSKSRFPTIMCRSIDSRQVGLSEATNLLYLDDCVEGRAEAKNRERLDAKWEVISGDVMGRALEGTPIVATGTRYSIYDPIGRLQDKAREQGWSWKAVEIPALDPVTDESNYEYYNPKLKHRQFTTEFFREQRDLLSQEQWESEFQQQPFEAKGLLFNKDDLNYFFELPVDTAPDSIVAIGDTAESGSDSTCMGVFYLYGDEAYLVDVVFDDSTPDVTKPECAKIIMDNHAGSGLFESNNAGQYYARDVDELLKQSGYRFSMRTKRTISNKQTRIELASDGIKKSFWFRHPSTYKRDSQYALFMRELTTYTRTGKVPHDDAPDMCSMAENEFRTLTAPSAEVLERPF